MTIFYSNTQQKVEQLNYKQGETLKKILTFLNTSHKLADKIMLSPRIGQFSCSLVLRRMQLFFNMLELIFEVVAKKASTWSFVALSEEIPASALCQTAL